MSDALLDRVSAALAAPVAEPVSRFAERLGRAAGAQAVLFYGSNLRTGLLDGVLDFYVLTPGSRERGLWPLVSYHEWTDGEQVLRAKIATMRLATFQAAASGETIDTTVWARFVQPCALLWSRDEADARTTESAIAEAVTTAAKLAVALGPVVAPAEDYWRALFRATYSAELRVEKAGREESILAANRDHFSDLLPLALGSAGLGYAEECTEEGTLLRPLLQGPDRRRLRRWWRVRAWLGKPYNLMRLLRAAATFDGAASYAAWKIERHTGLRIAVTPWRERHPLLAAPQVFWQVWRARQRKS